MSLVIMILLKTTSFINGTQLVSKFKLQKTMKTLKKNCTRCFEISSPLFICGITKKGFVF